MDLSIRVWQKDGEYVASCPELEIFTYGDSHDRATKRLKKVILFYAETASQLGYEIDKDEILQSLKMTGTEIGRESFVN